MAHMLAWQGVSLDAAKELAIGETSATIARVDADWEPVVARSSTTR